MKIICSWCRRAGKVDLVGEKIPLDDPRETHGICTAHRLQLEGLWKQRSYPSPATGDPQLIVGNTALALPQDPYILD
jgi:hypothetical protein